LITQQLAVIKEVVPHDAEVLHYKEMRASREKQWWQAELHVEKKFYSRAVFLDGWMDGFAFCLIA
jgi:hypothetical protein